MKQEEKLLIDRYLENSLTGIELKDFLDKLESDETFKKEVSFQNLLIEGIQYSEYKRHITLIKESIDYKKTSVPFSLKLIFTFLLITTGGIVLWNYIDPGSTGEKHNYFSLNFLRKLNKDSTNIHTENSVSKIKKTMLKNAVVSEDSSLNGGDTHTENNSLNQSDTSEIVVKKDQLLISVNMKLIDLIDQNSKDDNAESSISKKSADKLNPTAGLPESNNRRSEFYIVEYWVSPVNYKGYKLVNDKLILFGIEEPDAVQLYSKENKLWMKYGKDFYVLEPTEEFESLIKINEIPSALK